jgi:hypothetical protein
MVTVWLREVDAGTDNACWVACNKVDPGAVEFSSEMNKAPPELMTQRTIEGAGKYKHE